MAEEQGEKMEDPNVDYIGIPNGVCRQERPDRCQTAGAKEELIVDNLV